MGDGKSAQHARLLVPKCVSQKKMHDAPIYFRNHVSVLFSAQINPNKLPELLIKSELSRSPSNGRHAFFCTVHPGTIAMTDFRQRLRPKVLTRHLGDL